MKAEDLEVLIDSREAIRIALAAAEAYCNDQTFRLGSYPVNEPTRLIQARTELEGARRLVAHLRTVLMPKA